MSLESNRDDLIHWWTYCLIKATNDIPKYAKYSLDYCDNDQQDGNPHVLRESLKHSDNYAYNIYYYLGYCSQNNNYDFGDDS